MLLLLNYLISLLTGMYSKLRKFLLIFFLCLLVITYFLKRDYKTINNILPSLLESPLQSNVVDKEMIEFTKDGFAYSLTPVANYRIKALVVNEMDYRYFSVKNSDSVFPVDLCLIWGDNLSNNSYQDKSLSFHQDYRFCLYHWNGELSINPSQISNNHLISDDKKIISAISKIKPSDQIEISGYLVNVKAHKVGKVSKYDPSSFSMITSTNRNDDGAGACEVIYVNDVKILQLGHPFLSFLFNLSLYAVILLILLSVIVIVF